PEDEGALHAANPGCRAAEAAARARPADVPQCQYGEAGATSRAGRGRPDASGRIEARGRPPLEPGRTDDLLGGNAAGCEDAVVRGQQKGGTEDFVPSDRSCGQAGWLRRLALFPPVLRVQRGQVGDLPDQEPDLGSAAEV